MIEFKDIILKLRSEKELTQEDLAKELEVSKSTVAMWEIGKRFPSKEIYEHISDFFDVDIDYLYGRTNIRKKIHFDNDGTEYHALNSEYEEFSDPSARIFAYYLKNNPEYRATIDALKDVSIEDLSLVKDLIDRLKNK